MNGTAKKQVILTHIQKLIGRRMLESKRTKPCFYIEARADVTELMAVRPKLRKQIGVKITTNAFYIHTLALAVDKYPLMVGSLEADTIKIADSVNVGFAVNAPHGLLVPVLKNADKKTLAEIARQEQILTEKARSNELTLDDVQGETIALSNLGAYNLDSFIGIVPPPACAILAVGNVIPSVVAKDGKAASRKLLTLTIAVDGRIVSHSYAAKFLHLLKNMLQNPAQQF